MRVLPDECVPRGLRAELPGHEVKTVAEAGWAGVKNGALLQMAATQFDVLLTVDRQLEYQQNFSGLPISVVVIEAPSNDITVLRALMHAVREALPNAKPGTVTLRDEFIEGILFPGPREPGVTLCHREPAAGSDWRSLTHVRSYIITKCR